jgi:hypothetical protein
MRCDAYAEEDIKDAMNILSNITREHIHESALTTAAHILLCLTQDVKSAEQVAKEDFDSDLELVTVWADYMVGLNWMYKNNDGADGKAKWVATDNGKTWVLKVMNRYMQDDL